MKKKFYYITQKSSASIGVNSIDLSVNYSVSYSVPLSFDIQFKLHEPGFYACPSKHRRIPDVGRKGWYAIKESYWLLNKVMLVLHKRIHNHIAYIFRAVNMVS